MLSPVYIQLLEVNRFYHISLSPVRRQHHITGKLTCERYKGKKERWPWSMAVQSGNNVETSAQYSTWNEMVIRQVQSVSRPYTSFPASRVSSSFLDFSCALNDSSALSWVIINGIESQTRLFIDWMSWMSFQTIRSRGVVPLFSSAWLKTQNP